MKRFIKQIIILMSVGIIFSVVLSAVIDPYNVYHWKNVRDNGVEPNKNYIKMKYILDNPEKYDSLLFGSSRVGAIHVEKIEGERCYNMSYAYGTPSEHLANIRMLFSEGIYPKKIYVGVDSLSYTEDVNAHKKNAALSSYEYLKNPLHFIEIYSNLSLVMESIPETIEHQKNEEYNSILYEYGWWFPYDQKGGINWETDDFPIIGAHSRMDETLQEICEIVTLCKENNVELIIFTNPMYKTTHDASVDADYLIFLKRLAGITDYYNFSGLNDITTDKDNYLDTSHYNAYIGDMILECINNGNCEATLLEQGFGMYVTEDNVDQLIELLESEK